MLHLSFELQVPISFLIKQKSSNFVFCQVVEFVMPLYALSILKVTWNRVGDIGKKYYNFHPKGGWPFTDQDNGWSAVDCTAESLMVYILSQ